MHLYHRRSAKKPSAKKIPVTFLVALLLVSLAPAQAHAWTGYPETNVGLLPQTQWTKAAADAIPGFNASASKYVVYTGGTFLYNPSPNDTPDRRQHILCISSTDITFLTTNGQSAFRSTASFNCYTVYYHLEDVEKVYITTYATNSGSTSIYQGYYTQNIMDTLAYAVNVKFDSSYQSTKGVNDVPSTATKVCSALEFSCWMGDLGDNITGAVSGMAQNILKGIAFLFSPDSGRISAIFDNFQQFMNQKLGFLVYPFEFFGGFLGAFTSGSSWCSESSCNKNFGNIFGQPFTINLIQMKSTMPALWTYALLFLRGMLILALIYGIRRKYLEVMTR
ncbi:MAG TPA: hypothetical protein VF575_00610 [Candidatus Saccharimonadales bacterium]|jgi:hypothetical protein